MRFSTLGSCIPVLSTLVSATPVDTTPGLDLVKRANGPPEACFSIGKVGDNEEFRGCPPKRTLTDLAPDGTGGYCKPWPGIKDKCRAYCQTYLIWHYGDEIPVDNTWCPRGDCQLQLTDTVTVTQGSSFSMSVGTDVFNAGASFEYSESEATSVGMLLTKPGRLTDKCGYWTFVPHLISSCGWVGKATRHAGPAGWCADRVDSFECQQSQLFNDDGSASGDYIFVGMTCDRKEPLPWCFQEEIYLKERVAERDSVFEDYAAACPGGNVNRKPTEEARQKCLDSV